VSAAINACSERVSERAAHPRTGVWPLAALSQLSTNCNERLCDHSSSIYSVRCTLHALSALRSAHPLCSSPDIFESSSRFCRTRCCASSTTVLGPIAAAVSAAASGGAQPCDGGCTMTVSGAHHGVSCVRLTSFVQPLLGAVQSNRGHIHPSHPSGAGSRRPS
jgi:hypothetical protein